jgi:hypothetical protein
MQKRVNARYRLTITVAWAALSLGVGFECVGCSNTGPTVKLGSGGAAGGGGGSSVIGSSGGSGGTGRLGDIGTGGSIVSGTGGLADIGAGGSIVSGTGGAAAIGTGGSATGGGTGMGVTDAGQDSATGPDASAPDGSAGTPSGGGCPAGVVFCDDFESYSIGSLPGGKWHTATAPSAGFSMGVDGMHAFSGTKAVHVALAYPTDAYRAVNISTNPGVAGSAVYTRFMMYMTQWVRGTTSIHARFLVMGGYAVELNFTPTAYAIEVINDNFGSAAKMGPAPILNRWVCIQAQFGPKLALSVEGKQLDAPAGGGQGLQSLWIGMSTNHPITTDFWIDDFVVDSKPIVCPAGAN